MANSVYGLLVEQAEGRPHALAVRHKVGGAWRDVSWSQMRAISRQVAAWLVGEGGVAAGDRVIIWSATRYEWLVADLGNMAAGAVTVPIYQSTLADEGQYIIDNSGAVLVFAENEQQMEKLRRIRKEIPSVKKIVLMDGEPKDEDKDWTVKLADVLAYGTQNEPKHAAEIDARIKGVTPQDLLTIIYTSGTTGRPKGVMLPHDCGVYEAEAVYEARLMGPDDLQLLFLPLAHVFAKVIEVAWLKLGFGMAIAENLDKLVDNMGEVRPNMMCAVPRIFERVYTKVVTTGMSAGGLKGLLFKIAIEQSERAAMAEDKGEVHSSFLWTLGKALVFKKVGAKLNQTFGGRMVYLISGGAPLSRKIAYFFKYAGVKICEGYGLTESTAATCVNRPDNVKIGTVGPPLPGTQVKLAADGEILIKGRGVMRGYWKNDEATKESLDQEGWLHTGDIGSIDPTGHVRITDRKKEIIVTAGGKNIAPATLENAIKTNPYISQVMVHGDKRKFLSALFTVNEEAVSKWLQGKGISPGGKPLGQLPEVQALFQGVVDEFNKTVPSYETIKKFALLDKDFTIGDELTPSLKVKRKHCSQKYKAILDGFYGDDKFD